MPVRVCILHFLTLIYPLKNHEPTGPAFYLSRKILTAGKAVVLGRTTGCDEELRRATEERVLHRYRKG